MLWFPGINRFLGIGFTVKDGMLKEQLFSSSTLILYEPPGDTTGINCWFKYPPFTEYLYGDFPSLGGSTSYFSINLGLRLVIAYTAVKGAGAIIFFSIVTTSKSKVVYCIICTCYS
jgi:hypothetical protein